MKLLFYVQRLDTAHLTQRLAETFSADMPGSSFAALTYRDTPEAQYLSEQPGGLWQTILSEGDMHKAAARLTPDMHELKRIEATYGLPTLWFFVTQNRFLTMQNWAYLFRYGTPYSREEILAHAQLRFQQIEQLLDDFQPDIIVYPEVDVGPSSAFILERVAKQRGIPVLVPISARVGSYHTFTGTVFSEADHIEQRFRAYCSGELAFDQTATRELLTQFREGRIPLSYIDDELQVHRKDAKTDIVKRALKRRLSKPYFRSSDPFFPSFFSNDSARIMMALRRMRLAYHDIFEQPKAGEKYVFFPLHVEPEIALILYAPFYTDQLSIIRNVAQSLPVDTCLYVKDHVVGRGKRPLSFYKQLKGIPNVRLLDSGLNAQELIRNSEGVVTVTGTAGLEAILHGKPVITYGDVFYNVADDMVFHTHSFEETPYLIGRFADFQADDQMILNFLAALVDVSIPVDPLVLAKAIAKHNTVPAAPEPTEAFELYQRFLLGHIRAALGAGVPGA